MANEQPIAPQLETVVMKLNALFPGQRGDVAELAIAIDLLIMRRISDMLRGPGKPEGRQ